MEEVAIEAEFFTNLLCLLGIDFSLSGDDVDGIARGDLGNDVGEDEHGEDEQGHQREAAQQQGDCSRDAHRATALPTPGCAELLRQPYVP